tara:strand:+ start:1515 stop:1991 length:477 start_codon:yes stop_codon:yes gene_type:complete
VPDPQRELLAVELALQLLDCHLQLAHLCLARLQLLERGVPRRERVVLALAALAGEQSAQLEHLLHEDAAARREREDGVACRRQLALRLGQRRAQADDLHVGLGGRGRLGARRRRGHSRGAEAAVGWRGALIGWSGSWRWCGQCGSWHVVERLVREAST